MHNYTFQPVLKWLCHEDIADFGIFCAEVLTQCFKPMLKILPYSYEEDINIFHQGTLTKIFLRGWLLKVLWHGQGCLGDRCKGTQNNKEIKEKKLNKWIPFLFLTETPFGKFKWRSFDVWMPSVLYKGWNYKVIYVQSRKKELAT